MSSLAILFVVCLALCIPVGNHGWKSPDVLKRFLSRFWKQDDNESGLGLIAAIDVACTVLGKVDISRKCVIKLKNAGNRTLKNHMWFLRRGIIKGDLQDPIRPGETAEITFAKTSYSIAGSAGVLVYEVDGTTNQVAVMWSVPFDYAFHSNEFNIQILDNKKANDTLYTQMEAHEDKQIVSNSGYMFRKNRDGIAVSGAMTNGANASLNVTVKFEETAEYSTKYVIG